MTPPYNKVHLFSTVPLCIKLIYCSLCLCSVSTNASFLTEMKSVRRTCSVWAKVTVNSISGSVTRRNFVTLARGIVRRCGRDSRVGRISNWGFGGRRRVPVGESGVRKIRERTLIWKRRSCEEIKWRMRYRSWSHPLIEPLIASVKEDLEAGITNGRAELSR